MSSPHPPDRSGLVVAVLAFAGIVAATTQTLVIPLITELPALLHTSASNASWVITVTLLTAAVFTPVSGKLGDMYGKRRVLLAVTVPLIAGSVVCALASSVETMIVGRGLQGMGMGIIPLGISLLRDVLPAERLGSAIAFMSASMGVGGALGLPVAAAVAEYANWRALFWGSAALNLAIAVLVLMIIPAVRPDAVERRRFDYLGALGLGGALVCLLLGVSKGADWGWGSGLTIAMFGGAAVLLLAWGWWELRVPGPLVDLRVTARPQVLWTNVASVFLGVAMYAQSIVMPQILQLPAATGYGLGQSMIAMGLWMAPSGLMMMLLSPVGARITARWNAKVTLALGSAVVALGYGSAQLLLGTAAGLMVSSIVSSAGVGLAYGAMPALIMAAVPHHETGAANAFNTIMRSVGTSTGAAIIGSILAHVTVDLAGTPVPALSGFRISLAIGCGVAVAAAVIAALIPLNRRTTPDESEREATPAEGGTGALVRA
jgi:MFS family permease